jgi:hypothetical protein
MNKRQLEPRICVSPTSNSRLPAKVQERSSSPLGQAQGATSMVKFKQPMTFVKADVPSPSKHDIWKKELGLDDLSAESSDDGGVVGFMTDDDEDEINSATECDRKNEEDRSTALEVQVLQIELNKKDRLRDDLLLKLQTQTEKTNLYEKKYDHLEQNSKSQLKILRATFESALKKKDELISSLQVIIAEQEAKMDTLLMQKGGDDLEVQISVSKVTKDLVLSIEQLQRDLLKRDESLAEHELKKTRMQQTIDEHKKEIEEKYLSKSVHDKIAEELTCSKKKVAEMKSELEEKAAISPRASEQLEKLQSEISSLKKSSYEQLNTIEQQKRTIANLECDVSKLNSENQESTEKLEADVKALKARARNAENQYRDLVHTPPKLKKQNVIPPEITEELSQLKHEKSNLKAELLRSRHELEELKMDYNKENLTQQEQYEGSQKTLQTKLDELHEVTKEVKELRSTISALEGRS